MQKLNNGEGGEEDDLIGVTSDQASEIFQFLVHMEKNVSYQNDMIKGFENNLQYSQTEGASYKKLIKEKSMLS